MSSNNEVELLVNITNLTDTGYGKLPDVEVSLESEAGAIVGLLFGSVFVIGMVIFAALVIRNKRNSDMDYRQKLRTHRSTKENAGVYLDTTVSDDFIFQSNDTVTDTTYISLKDNSDMYNISSGDEL